MPVSTSHLFCFGLGFTARALATAAVAEGWRVTATRRPAQNLLPPPDGVTVVAFDRTNPLTPDTLTGVTHLLSSVPPDSGGDPVIDWHFFDLARLPITHRKRFEETQVSLLAARENNSHERCRRFESAELTLSPQDALTHVETRSQDLSQARPEYNHATNGLCFVGRREWSRGLFLDRRAFLTSYDPELDDENCTILERILQAVIPVCAGISLEYYFSTVDSEGYGCGSKLPHNITSLLGVMTGAASDLKPGLSSQMVEIHEPVRILFVVETTPTAMLKIIDQNPAIAQLCRGDWVQLATLDAASSAIHLYRHGGFEEYSPGCDELPEAETSADWYSGQREHLAFATITGPQE